LINLFQTKKSHGDENTQLHGDFELNFTYFSFYSDMKEFVLSAPMTSTNLSTKIYQASSRASTLIKFEY